MSRAEPNLFSPRINRVLDYIADHLTDDLSLSRLAELACFSPFHFHRIFKGQTGETLNAFVRRQRLERAAKLLRTAPQRTLTEIALEVGFASSADFSRAFKDRFGFPPGRWDRETPMPDSKIRQAPDGFPHYSQDSPAADREFLDEIAEERGVSEARRIRAAVAEPTSAEAEEWGIGVRELPAEALATLRQAPAGDRLGVLRHLLRGSRETQSVNRSSNVRYQPQETLR